MTGLPAQQASTVMVEPKVTTMSLHSMMLYELTGSLA